MEMRGIHIGYWWKGQKGKDHKEDHEIDWWITFQ
jgi:hypothetical protein